MENLVNPAASPITPAELLTRQLRDWQGLRSQLAAENDRDPSVELIDQIAYCGTTIDRLEAELSLLHSTPEPGQ